MKNGMKKLFLFAILIFNHHFMNAQDKDPWTVYMMPSDVHASLSQFTGSFIMQITMSMGAGKEPTIITVDSEHKMLLGGRFLEMKQQGTMMGMDYQSISTIGFNNIDRNMSLTTITNMGTGTLSLHGAWDEKAKTGDLFGQLTNPVTKSIIKVRQTVTFVDDDTILIESYDTEGDNPEKKTVQYKLIRNK
jgi:Protein of unknown function (DUF1579)